MSDVAVELSMFERIGGAVVIDRLVEAFYGRMDALPEAKRHPRHACAGSRAGQKSSSSAI